LILIFAAITKKAKVSTRKKSRALLQEDFGPRGSVWEEESPHDNLRIEYKGVNQIFRIGHPDQMILKNVLNFSDTSVKVGRVSCNLEELE
jgi:hypothetical protein